MNSISNIPNKIEIIDKKLFCDDIEILSQKKNILDKKFITVKYHDIISYNKKVCLSYYKKKYHFIVLNDDYKVIFVYETNYKYIYDYDYCEGKIYALARYDINSDKKLIEITKKQIVNIEVPSSYDFSLRRINHIYFKKNYIFLLDYEFIHSLNNGKIKRLKGKIFNIIHSHIILASRRKIKIYNFDNKLLSEMRTIDNILYLHVEDDKIIWRDINEKIYKISISIF